MEILIGQTIDHYRIDSLLGEGGMGAVYRATDLNLARQVALKVMHNQYSRQTQFRDRFLQEARAAARLNHPSIVDIYHFGVADKLLYIVMEYIPGGTLQKYLRQASQAEKAVPLSETLCILAQAADALGYAHKRDILHRDIKPDNILLQPLEAPDRPGEAPLRALISDFGLAKLVEGGIQTQTGTFMGTLPYMSPEQALGGDLDGRSDLYSLGVILYQLVTGQLPFDIKSPTDAVLKHQNEIPAQPREIVAAIPGSVAEITMQAIAKAPADRYQSGTAMAAAIRDVMATLSDSEATQFAPPEKSLNLVTLLEASSLASLEPPKFEEDPVSLTPSKQDQLQVYRQNEPPQLVPINGEKFTIGRSEENDLFFDDPKVSRRHTQISFEGKQYLVTDLESANGTYLGDHKLLPGVPEIWNPDKALRIGNNWLRLLPAGQPPTTTVFRQDGSLVDLSFATMSPGTGRVAIFLEDPQLSVEPAGQISTALTILNQGETVDHYTIEVRGIPAKWITLAPSTLQLLPGAQERVSLTISPPRDTESKAGRYSLTIQVLSQDSPDQVAEVTGTLTVAPFSQYRSELRPQVLSTGGKAAVLIQNQGNLPETFSLTFKDRADSLIFSPPETQIQVPAGQSISTDFSARLRQRQWVGGKTTHPFTANIASPGGQIQTASGELTSRGLIPTWVFPAVFFLCILFSSGAGLIYNQFTTGNQRATQSEEARVIGVTQIAQGQDSDGDGLLDVDEGRYGTDPQNPDTDSDDLSDKVEIDQRTDPLSADTDGDGLLDGEEQRAGTDALAIDTDGDTLSDGLEVNDMKTSPINLDTDSDGLNDNVDPDPLNPPTSTPSPTSTPAPTALPTEIPTPTPTPTPDITSGLLTYYPFDMSFEDLSGNGFTGRRGEDANCFSYVTDRFGFAERAAGLSLCNNSPSPPYDHGLIEANHINFSENFTLAGWINRQTGGGNHAWIVGQKEWAAMFIQDGFDFVAFGFPASDETIIIDTNPLPREEWHFYAVTVSSSGEEATIRLFRDGLMVDQQATTASLFINPDSAELHIGSSLLGGNTRVYLYKGALDDITIYSRALTETEILYLFEKDGQPVSP